MTALIDTLGHPVSGATAAAIEHYELAAHELRCLIGDPLAAVDRALAEAPGMSIAHTLRAWLHLLGTEAPALDTAREAADAAARHASTERERLHAHAAALVAAGRWRDGARVLEDLSALHPRDLLALQAGHQWTSSRGDSRMLRDRVARVLPHWNDAMPGHHAVLGMHAFGLEETGDYAQAERTGRRGVELRPRDTWAWHAVAHVHEMRNAPRTASPGSSRTRRTGREAASSRSTTGGIWRCSTWNRTATPRCSRCTTNRSAGQARRSCST